MTLPPLPGLIAIGLLLGWPLIQLLSVVLVTKSRARMRTLAAELRSEASDDPISLKAIERAVASSHGEPAYVVFPIIIPLAIFAASVWELFGRDRPSKSGTKEYRERRKNRREDIEKLSLKLDVERGFACTGSSVFEVIYAEKASIYTNKKYRDLLNKTFEIGFMRWPISLSLTVLFSLPFLPLYLVAYGLRETENVIPRLARDFATKIKLTPQNT